MMPGSDISNTLRAHLAPLLSLLENKDTTEICINRPGEIWRETKGQWFFEQISEMDVARLNQLKTICANYPEKQEISRFKPLLSNTIPTGHRLQIVIPPATEYPCFTFRRASATNMSLEQLNEIGYFNELKSQHNHLDQVHSSLISLAAKHKWPEFFREAVVNHMNILIAGATGSGKTTFAKSLIANIPHSERIITIEDTRELTISQPNRTHLIYSKGAQGSSEVTAKDLLEASLRMRPDRVIMQELRDSAAFFFLRNINTGHPGSITTIHASSAMKALDQLLLLIKESEGGNHLSPEDIKILCRQSIDIVVFCRREGPKYMVGEVKMLFKS